MATLWLIITDIPSAIGIASQVVSWIKTLIQSVEAHETMEAKLAQIKTVVAATQVAVQTKDTSALEAALNASGTPAAPVAAS